MDAAVLRAMQQWPNVPSVYGWLALDRRGNWLIKSRTGRFESITNVTMIEFIGRNYSHDKDGRWYFQNGPQQVFVSLDYTPWVYRLNDTAADLVTQSGARPCDYRALYLDETGTLLIETDLGIGAALDRDLSSLLALVNEIDGKSAEDLIDAVAHGGKTECRFLDRVVPFKPIDSREVPQRFGFIQKPTPPPGQPDC